MKSMAELLSLSEIKKIREDENNQQKTARVVNAIFRVILDNCPAYKQAWPTQEDLNNAKKAWLRELMKRNITSLEQIKYGLERCVQNNSPFVPKVIEFIEWCKPTPEVLGLPDVDDAYEEALKNSRVGERKSWTHQAIYHAWSITNTYNLVNFSREKSFALFQKSYNKTAQLIANGEPLRIIQDALPEKSAVFVKNPEKANTALSGIYGMLKGSRDVQRV